MIADYPDDLVAYQIHTSGSGPISEWGSARVSFYSVGGIPDVWVDGVLQQLGSMGSDQANYNNLLNLMNQRLAVPTDVTLELYAAPLSGQTYRVTAVIGIEADGEGKTMIFHLAQALFGFPVSADGRYNNGIIQGLDPTEITLEPGETEFVIQELTFNAQSWALQDDIRIIGLLQETNTGKEIYQSEIIPWPFPQFTICAADITGDGTVDVLDLLEVLSGWGAPGIADITGDGTVDVLDLLEVLSGWGPCPEDMGACCMWDGTCEDMAFLDCMVTGPAEWRQGEECASIDCPDWPIGACCVGIDCVDTNTEYECFVEGGVWSEGEDCASYVCKPIYCDSASGSCDYEYIKRVQCGTIDNSSNCGYYQDFTDFTTDMIVGQATEIAVTDIELFSSDKVTVWVDWNKNGDLEDEGEKFLLDSAVGGVATGEITPPADAVLGTTRMRVNIQWGGTAVPCGSFNYGEVEDYTVNVIAAPKR